MEKGNRKKGRGLMFVNAKLNEEHVKTLIDTGASRNFLSENEDNKTNIQYTKEIGCLKAVNSLSEPILGVAHGVPIEIGGWKSMVDLTIVFMDDYRLMLGMEFLDKVRPFSFKEQTMHITKGSTIHIIPVERSKTDFRTLLSMQLNKGLRKGEMTFLATIKENDHTS